MLRKALEINPGLAKTHFFLGTALKTLRPLRRGARRTCAPRRGEYPRDRVVLNQIGRVLFLQRQFARGDRGLHSRCSPSIPRICRRTTT